MADEIINLSALARLIRPEIERELMKPVSESAILMALKRYSPKIPHKSAELRKVLSKMGDMTVRSNLMEFTFKRGDTLLEKLKHLLQRIEQRRDTFVTFTQGIYEVTVIVSADLAPDVKHIFFGETIISSLSDLAAVIIRLSPQTVVTPGVHYSILKQLAWKNINVVEVVSTFSEFTIILEKKNVDLTFSILMKFFDRM